MKFIIVVICLVILMSPTSFAGKLYKWVDKDGVVHVTDDPSTIPHEYRSSVEESNPKGASGATIEKIEKGSKKAFDEVSRLVKESMKKEKVLTAVLLIIVLIALAYILRGYLKLKEQQKRERRLRALELSNIDNMDGIEFEHYVSRLLAHHGFKVEVTKGSVDFGVDVIAQKNDLKYAVQVKRYNDPVSRRAVSDAVAGKYHYDCNAAMVVTNNYFTEGAKELAHSTGCELVDRDILAEWILDFQNSNNTISSY